ncbi:MAG: phospholipase D-like domain-containing protein [Minisyncoccia bacterium]
MKIIIPEILLIEDKEVTVISPFISNFPLIIPKNHYNYKNKFLDFLFELVKRNNIKLKIYTSNDIGTLNEVKNKLKEYFDEPQKYLVVKENLHEKALITSTYIYLGSANFTYNGFYVNLEQCQIGLIKDNEKLVNEILRKINEVA